MPDVAVNFTESKEHLSVLPVALMVMLVVVTGQVVNAKATQLVNGNGMLYGVTFHV